MARLKIALVGKNQTGTRFLAYRLQKIHGFQRKRMMAGVDKIIRQYYMHSDYAKKINWEKRVMIYDALYTIDNDIHINYMLKRFDMGSASLVVEDCRYENELRKLKQHGFIIIRINPTKKVRPRIVNFDKAGKGLISVLELYPTNSSRIEADYSLTFDDKEETAKAIDNLIGRLKEIEQINSPTS